jgi:hypothetical protein
MVMAQHIFLTSLNQKKRLRVMGEQSTTRENTLMVNLMDKELYITMTAVNMKEDLLTI